MRNICKIIIPLLGIFFIQGNAQDRIVHNGQEVFLSGMNLAWVNFAYDLTNFNQTEFTRALDEISAYGGNALRWWLHVNGSASPQFTDGMVSGITAEEIESMELGLDLAAERGMGIVMCLWSFDMLQDNAGSANWERNRNLVQDSLHTQAYIDNALTPIIDSLGDHPAVICWEVFNEPEGMSTQFGWTPERVDMSDIQQFINLIAGAIHRLNPEAKVSNGSWSFQAATDAGSGNYNYYSDERLIGAGNDPDGTLDFYMVHYYDHFPTSRSPFHHPASYWELDKPLVIGEFSAHGPYGNMTPTEAYNYLFDNGYAGALSWTWTGHDGHGDVTDAGPAMEDLYIHHTDDVVMNYDGYDINRVPRLVKSIPDTAFALGSGPEVYVNLKDHFYDYEDSTNLTYSIEDQTSTETAELSLEDDSVLFIVPGSVAGVNLIDVRATDSGGKQGRGRMAVSVYDPGAENKALFRRAWSSTDEDGEKVPVMAIDGDFETRWSSIYANNQWLAVQLYEEYTLQSVVLYWEAAYALDYEIQISSDGSTWSTVSHTETGNGGRDIINFDPVAASYVRMYANTRATEWGNSLWEFEVYESEIVDGLVSGSVQEFEVFPNPADNFAHIILSAETSWMQCALLDLSGREVLGILNREEGSTQIRLDLQGVSPGSYFIKVITSEGPITEKLIIR